MNNYGAASLFSLEKLVKRSCNYSFFTFIGGK